MKRLALFLLAVLLVLAACGGSGGETVATEDTNAAGRVKVSDTVGSAPQSLPADETGEPAGRGTTGITSDAVAACMKADEAELARLINEYRASLNLPAVPLSKSLTLVAQQHAWDSETNGNAWPPPPPGKTCNMHSWTDRVNPALQEGTWTPVCYTNDHDNSDGSHIKPQELAGYPGNGVENSYFSISMSGGATPAGALAAWKNSPGHNAVITEQGWARPLAMGVGIKGGYAHLWFGYVADPAGEAQRCRGQAQSPTPTPAVQPTTVGVAAPTVPPSGGSAGGRRATPTSQILDEDGIVSANSLMLHRFNVESGRTYAIVVTPSAELDVSPTINCTTDGGDLSETFDWHWEGGVEKFTYDAPGNGSCGVNVKGYEDSSGTYNIKVTFAP